MKDNHLKKYKIKEKYMLLNVRKSQIKIEE